MVSKLRFRFSLLTLMAGMTALAIGMAVLARPSYLATSFLLNLTFVVLGVALVGALTSGPTSRSFWIGFAAFGWGYLTLSIGPWFADSVRPFLLTNLLLDYLWIGLGREIIGFDLWPDRPDPFYIVKTQVAGYAYFSFLFTGHALWALLAAGAGGLLGRFFHNRRPPQ